MCSWRSGRVVECTGLENRSLGNGTVSSNLTSSAVRKKYRSDLNSPKHLMGCFLVIFIICMQKNKTFLNNLIHKITGFFIRDSKNDSDFSLYTKYLNDCEKYFEQIEINNPNNLDAIIHLNEFLYRLNIRFEDLKKAEYLMYNLNDSDTKKIVTEKQLKFVNRLEAYFQQLYAVISALALFVNKTADHEFKQGLAIGSNKKFLNYLKEKVESIEDEVVIIERARSFRSDFIDHTQQKTLHNWITSSFPGEKYPLCVVTYYIKKGNEVYFRGLQLDPYSKDYMPPVNYESFVISPPHDKCHENIFSLCKKTVNKVAANKNKTDPNS